ncbi:MAG: response regulator [SAR324 cluster bacterium]|nr:response regulator [SAR324 cluster bacterium]
MREKATIAHKIASGDLLVRAIPISAKDDLAVSLNDMIDALLRFRQESATQDWLKTGQNQLSVAMSGSLNVGALCENILKFVCDYLECPVGTLYLVRQSSQELELKAGLGISHTVAKKLIPIGEGLVGKTAETRKSQHLKAVPGEALMIESGIVKGLTSELFLFPLLKGETLIGVLELGKFTSFTREQRHFIEVISSQLAINLVSSQGSQITQDLLQRTQEQSEALQLGQQKLQKTNEDLQEQTRNLQLSKDKLRQQQEELKAFNEELSQAKNALERKAAELELADKYKSEFLANMSHELLTPLNSMLILSRTLLDNDEKNLSPEQLQSLGIVHQSGTDLLNLINQILDLSRIESGQVQVFDDVVVLEDVGMRMQQIFRHMAEEKQLQFRFSVDPSLPHTILTDRQKLEQILKNLIANAIKFTHRGQIEVIFEATTSSAENKALSADVSEKISISVKDTGIGIMKDQLDLIFEAFHQADGSITRTYGGTGLGLSISKKLGELLGGKITVTSEYGAGSMFTLILPLNIPNVDATPRQSTVETLPDTEKDADDPNEDMPLLPDNRLLGKSILIVDDDMRNAFALATALGKFGMKPYKVANGQKALDFLKTQEVDLMLLDLMMPEMDGLETLRQLHERQRPQKLPVIVLTARNDPESHQSCLDAGAKICLLKPFNMSVLMQYLTLYLTENEPV